MWCAQCGEVCAVCSSEVQWWLVRCSEVQRGVQRGAVRCRRAAWSSEVHGAVQWGAVCLTPPVNVQCSVGMLIFCYKISIFTLRFFTSIFGKKFFFILTRPPISFSLDFHFISDFTDRLLSFILRLWLCRLHILPYVSFAGFFNFKCYYLLITNN